MLPDIHHERKNNQDNNKHHCNTIINADNRRYHLTMRDLLDCTFNPAAISLRLAVVHHICYCELLEVSPEDHALHQANISNAHTEPSMQIRHQKRTTRQIKLPAANGTGNSIHIASEKWLAKINMPENQIQISEIRLVLTVSRYSTIAGWPSAAARSIALCPF